MSSTVCNSWVAQGAHKNQPTKLPKYNAAMAKVQRHNIRAPLLNRRLLFVFPLVTSIHVQHDQKN
jgi:hypothetical protein